MSFRSAIPLVTYSAAHRPYTQLTDKGIALVRIATPLFLCVKTFEMAGGIEKYDNCPKRQRTLCNVMLSLGFERLDTLNFIRLAEGYDEPFKERNKGNIPIPFFIFIPKSCSQTDQDFFKAYML